MFGIRLLDECFHYYFFVIIIIIINYMSNIVHHNAYDILMWFY